MLKQSECSCDCHRLGSSMIHCFPCCEPDEIAPVFHRVLPQSHVEIPMPPLPSNPKDRNGRAKVSLSLVPAVAIAHEAHAFMDGAAKYGPYNWRDNAVIASIYIDACKRHLDLWFDELQECADDSEVHHLGHARACLGIILDAMETGNLIDDRPKPGKLSAVYRKIMDTIKRRKEAA